MPSYTLKELASQLQLEFKGNPDHQLVGVSALLVAGPDELSFCRSVKQASMLADTQAGAVILPAELAETAAVNCLIAKDPEASLVGALALLHPSRSYSAGVHASAVIDSSVNVPESAHIGPHVIIEAGVSLGENVVILAGCAVSANCQLGDGVHLAANVVLYDNVRLGNRVSIHASSVIGADGFGYHRAGHAGAWLKVPQVGGVIVGDDVEIGASTTIDRGALTDTVIKRGVKIDNQVMIAHNVQIGEDTAIAGCTGIAGSTEIGSNCIIAGHCGIADNITITDQVILLGGAAVTKSIQTPGLYSSGTGLHSRSAWQRMVVRLRGLDKFIKETTKKLEKIDG